MTISATVRKSAKSNARVEIMLRAVTGEIVFVGPDPVMLQKFKNGQQVEITIKTARK